MQTSQRHQSLSIIAATAYVVGIAACFMLDDPRLRYPSFVGGQALASAGFLSILALRPHGRSLLVWIGIGVGLKVWALQLSPAFSDDVFRYLYEGKIVLWGGLSFPFQHPPADAPSLGVPAAFMDHAWLRINHSELATIYPPLSLLVFGFSAVLTGLSGGSQLWVLKAILLSFDLLIWRLLHRLHPLSGLFWGLCPLTIFEVSREGHVDVLSALGLTIGALGCLRHRPTHGYLGWFLAAGAKLNGLLMVPLALRITRRGSWLIIPCLALIVAPYLYAEHQATSGLAAYTTRWRSGDGAYVIVLEGATRLLGGEWLRLNLWGAYVTITRHQLARVMIAALFLAVYGKVLVSAHGQSLRNIPSLGGFLIVVLLLLSPTLHPWYLIWTIPFVAIDHFYGRSAAVWLILCAPLLHHPAWMELRDGYWRHLPLVQAIIHVPAWILLIKDDYSLEPARQTR
ncbi:MAG: hypothetical protein KTR25_14755 [Myxococcales bacterium]|nr:hypothetical protein [Myxococcales bacterium]